MCEGGGAGKNSVGAYSFVFLDHGDAISLAEISGQTFPKRVLKLILKSPPPRIKKKFLRFSVAPLGGGTDAPPVLPAYSPIEHTCDDTQAVENHGAVHC